MSSTRTALEPQGARLPDPGGSGRPTRTPGHRRTWRRALRRDWQLYSLAILPLLFFVVFRYLPMLGNVIAFRRFQPGDPIVAVPSAPWRRPSSISSRR